MLGAFPLDIERGKTGATHLSVQYGCALRESPNCLGHRCQRFTRRPASSSLYRSSRYQLRRDSTNAYSSKRGFQSSADLVPSFPIDVIELSVPMTLATSTWISKYSTSSASYSAFDTRPLESFVKN